VDPSLKNQIKFFPKIIATSNKYVDAEIPTSDTNISFALGRAAPAISAPSNHLPPQLLTRWSTRPPRWEARGGAGIHGSQGSGGDATTRVTKITNIGSTTRINERARGIINFRENMS
jgi:hypothetical protein